MSLHLALAASVTIGLLWLIVSAGWGKESRLWKREETSYGRLYVAAALGGVGTVVLVYFFGDKVIELSHLLFRGRQNGFGELVPIPFTIGVGLSLFPPLAVWLAGGMLGRTRRKRVAGMMAFNQFLMFVPVSFTPLPIIAVIMLALTGIHPLVSLFGIPALLSMASLWFALTETKEANKRETPAPERAVEERPVDGW